MAVLTGLFFKLRLSRQFRERVNAFVGKRRRKKM
jgi:hypothetical protein